MPFSKFLLNPLTGATILLGMAGFWAYSFTSANGVARESAQTVRPWIEIARFQMADVGACELKSRAKAELEFPNEADAIEREMTARHAAFECSAPYMLEQKVAASAASAQVLGYEATAAMRAKYLGKPFELSPAFAPLYAKASADAKSATAIAFAADAALAQACSGMVSSSACALGHLTPDTPDRRLADGMREFELDVHAQYWIATHPAEELARQTKTGTEALDPKASESYAFARSVVFAK